MFSRLKNYSLPNCPIHPSYIGAQIYEILDMLKFSEEGYISFIRIPIVTTAHTKSGKHY